MIAAPLARASDRCEGTDDLEPGNQDDLLPTGELQQCSRDLGGGPVFDLSGNVWEWTNACDELNVADADQDCRRRGGSFYSQASVLRCNLDGVRARNFRNSNTGFRCCASL